MDHNHLDMFLVSFFHLFPLNQGREAEGAEEATSHVEGGDVVARLGRVRRQARRGGGQGEPGDQGQPGDPTEGLQEGGKTPHVKMFVKTLISSRWLARREW